MTCGTALAQGLMFKDERSALRSMALETSLVLAEERDAAAFERLLNVRPTALDRHSDMRIVAICTTDLAFKHRMTMRELETCTHLEVTLETRFG
jgi:hypothetical protein